MLFFTLTRKFYLINLNNFFLIYSSPSLSFFFLLSSVFFLTPFFSVSSFFFLLSVSAFFLFASFFFLLSSFHAGLIDPGKSSRPMQV